MAVHACADDVNEWMEDELSSCLCYDFLLVYMTVMTSARKGYAMGRYLQYLFSLHSNCCHRKGKTEHVHFYSCQVTQLSGGLGGRLLWKLQGPWLSLLVHPATCFLKLETFPKPDCIRYLVNRLYLKWCSRNWEREQVFCPQFSILFLSNFLLLVSDL